MGPTKMDNLPVLAKSESSRPRRGSLPELKTSDKAAAEKKVPTGPRANPLYKTRLCMNFQSTGSCPYTEKCQFAHGVKELEKWESWRTSHKGPDDQKKDSPGEDETGIRSRSQSMEDGPQFHLNDDFGSPEHMNWDLHSSLLSTPIKRSSLPIDMTPPSSDSSNFSLWSTLMDNIENTQPPRSNTRTRAATYDSTYDNMSQLRDAPTLFPSPPVLPSLGVKYRMSH